MRLALTLLAAGWFAASVWAGYALADRSFAWVDDALAPRGQTPGGQTPTIDFDALKSKLPAPGQDPIGWLQSLSPAAQACLREAVGEERFQAAVRAGAFEPTPQEMAAALKCL